MVDSLGAFEGRVLKMEEFQPVRVGMNVVLKFLVPEEQTCVGEFALDRLGQVFDMADLLPLTAIFFWAVDRLKCEHFHPGRVVMKLSVELVLVVVGPVEEVLTLDSDLERPFGVIDIIAVLVLGAPLHDTHSTDMLSARLEHL